MYRCPKCFDTDLRVEVPFVMAMDSAGHLAVVDEAPIAIDDVTHQQKRWTLCNECSYGAPLHRFWKED